MKRFSRAAVLGATALAAGLVGTAAQAQVEIITVTGAKSVSRRCSKRRLP